MTKPTENELFEEFAYGEGLSLGHTHDLFGIAEKSWYKRAELADKEIAELQAQIEYLILMLSSIGDKKTGSKDKWAFDLANEALTKTTPQCLIEHDNKIYDNCIDILEDAISSTTVTPLTDCIDKIKALKG